MCGQLSGREGLQVRNIPYVVDLVVVEISMNLCFVKEISWMKGACFEVFGWAKKSFGWGQLVIGGRTQQRVSREQHYWEEPFAGPGSNTE